MTTPLTNGPLTIKSFNLQSPRWDDNYNLVKTSAKKESDFRVTRLFNTAATLVNDNNNELEKLNKSQIKYQQKIIKYSDTDGDKTKKYHRKLQGINSQIQLAKQNLAKWEKFLTSPEAALKHIQTLESLDSVPRPLH